MAESENILAASLRLIPCTDRVRHIADQCRRCRRSYRSASSSATFDDATYIFELKYDGFRAVAYIDKGSAKLVSRKGHTYKRFDDLCAGIADAVKAKDAIIDGGIVCLNAAGKSRTWKGVSVKAPNSSAAAQRVVHRLDDQRDVHIRTVRNSLWACRRLRSGESDVHEEN